jgi:hypothetical protein
MLRENLDFIDGAAEQDSVGVMPGVTPHRACMCYVYLRGDAAS